MLLRSDVINIDSSSTHPVPVSSNLELAASQTFQISRANNGNRLVEQTVIVMHQDELG